MQGEEDGCGLPTRISWRMNSISRDSGGSALITIDALLAAAANEGDDIAQVGHAAHAHTPSEP